MATITATITRINETLPVLSARSGWEDLASCRDPTAALTRLFFSDELQDIGRAKRICSGCPVISECLEQAVANREPAGVWGGQMFLNGRILVSKRPRGRPPKIPRPEHLLPDVPVPEHLRSAIA